jgi:tetratricopeptide (TPR) repeat protein
MRTSLVAAAFVILLQGSVAQAGLYYSAEQIAPLPSQWRGYLLDQRLLRSIAVKPAKGAAANPARQCYLQAAEKLENASADRKLTADEQADLGALYIRLGDAAKAITALRAAQRDHANHFAIAANLGTAWQMQGDLGQAAAALEQAVKLAPGKLQRAEEYHLKLVRLRQKAEKTGGLDDLFGIRFVGESGKLEPGKLAAAEKKKLPSDAGALLQQLGLWLPADGPVLWQMAELASALGDVRSGASMADGCVTEFGLGDADLRQHRRAFREAADALGEPAAGTTAKTVHEEGHPGGLGARSKRPLVSRVDQTDLPAVNEKGVNSLPWSVIAETTVDRRFKATFAKYLTELEGKKVTLTGYIQPLGEDLEMTSFMFIEYPVGCWYCEMPEITGIMFVELPAGKTLALTRNRIKVTGTLKLNATDPENFLYLVRKAEVVEEDK